MRLKTAASLLPADWAVFQSLLTFLKNILRGVPRTIRRIIFTIDVGFAYSVSQIAGKDWVPKKEVDVEWDELEDMMTEHRLPKLEKVLIRLNTPVGVIIPEQLYTMFACQLRMLQSRRILIFG